MMMRRPTRSLLWPELAFALVTAAAPVLADEVPNVGKLANLVRQDCGSCHGLTLKGGLGPPLLPEALRDKPAESLRYTVLLGRPGTPMPPWNTFMSEAEADWIVRQLKQGFPEETH